MCEKLLRWLMPWRYRLPPVDIENTFQVRYKHFQALLESNAELSRTIGDIEEKLRGYQLFGMTYIRTQARRAAQHTRSMIENLNALSGNKYPQLVDAYRRVQGELKEALGEIADKRVAPAYIIPLSDVRRDMVDWVGGKAANLGEVRNHTTLPVPEGFVISTLACEHFLSHHRLREFVEEKLDFDANDTQALNEASDEIKTRIISSPLPDALAQQILEAYDQLLHQLRQQNPTYDGEIAVRSSSIGEDSDRSHAGQYVSRLDVRREDLLDAYREVVASLFTASAIKYRLQNGVKDEDQIMSVLCLQMIDPVTAGVAFSRHPFGGLENVAVINAVWGLGLMAVDGDIIPDLYTVSRDDDLTLLSREVAEKQMQLTRGEDGKVSRVPVPEALRHQPCLDLTRVQALTRAALALEKHYGTAQDVEWALDAQERLWILQSRPLHMAQPSQVASSAVMDPAHPLLLAGGAPACPGVGAGPVVVLEKDDAREDFPEGAILVTRHPSPRFARFMRQASAIVTDTGSPLGHMASLAREHNTPTLLATRVATTSLKPGQLVTVDATSGRVYAGRVEALLEAAKKASPFMKDTPSWKVLERVARKITPLNLINPRAPEFSAESCRSLHDLMRFVHEASYAAMFRLSDLLSAQEGAAVALRAPIPLDLYLIDLGGGIQSARAKARSVTPDEVLSVPFRALLKGMLHADVQMPHARPIEVKGLFSVMTEQMLTPPDAGGERFGDRSYAILSDRYLHFSSRIGYHYSILDCYCDEQTRKSHLNFSFQGGAADNIRRERRAKAVAQILRALGFTVDQKSDRVEARMRRAEQQIQLETLDQLGRLLQFTRQLDMLMTSEASVQLASQAFLERRYRLGSPT